MNKLVITAANIRKNEKNGSFFGSIDTKEVNPGVRIAISAAGRARTQTDLTAQFTVQLSAKTEEAAQAELTALGFGEGVVLNDHKILRVPVDAYTWTNAQGEEITSTHRNVPVHIDDADAVMAEFVAKVRERGATLLTSTPAPAVFDAEKVLI
jgi:hypothetical protein